MCITFSIILETIGKRELNLKFLGSVLVPFLYRGLRFATLQSFRKWESFARLKKNFLNTSNMLDGSNVNPFFCSRQILEEGDLLSGRPNCFNVVLFFFFFFLCFILVLPQSMLFSFEKRSVNLIKLAIKRFSIQCFRFVFENESRTGSVVNITKENYLVVLFCMQ